MLPVGFWEQQSGVRVLYSKLVSPVCERFALTRMELDVLLFLANNPTYDTAAELIDLRHFAKSQVSATVKLLEQKGLLSRTFAPGNRKTVHLHLCSAAQPMITEGQAAQEHFAEILLCGFSDEERSVMQKMNERMHQNIKRFEKETKL